MNHHCALCYINHALEWPLAIIFLVLLLFVLFIMGYELLVLMIEKWPSFKVRCDGCDGTGLCTAPNPSFPHSCDGQCRRVYVPESWVPENFKGNWHEPGEKILGLTGYYWPFIGDPYPNTNKRYAMIGCGWVYGSLLQRLRKGGPRKQLGRQDRHHPPDVVAEKACQHHREIRS